MVMDRAAACHHVANLITGDRAKTHGSAVDQLAHSQILKEQVGHRNNRALSPTALEAIDMICVKLSRLANGTPIEDHWLDIIGYAAIAVEDMDKPAYGVHALDAQYKVKTPRKMKYDLSKIKY